ncbi:MAG: hypothetical protein QF495_12975, partial [SAR324 cluster bacterium]|nr:hypothetical protein [SAR324 cluster bacterium]
ERGGKWSTQNGSVEFENISYFEGNQYIVFMGQKIYRNEGVINGITNFDFNGDKLDKSGKLVIRFTRGMALSYNLTALNCDWLG